MKTRIKTNYVCYYTPKELADSLNPVDVKKGKGEYMVDKYGRMII